MNYRKFAYIALALILDLSFPREQIADLAKDYSSALIEKFIEEVEDE